ncbi:hypothetical protein DLJ46_24985 [Micromonospora globispora]|uniref:Uncharacterized protein n=1 Tax=Micromonospora globispora TaxID=1450148 RepID=A0A317JUY9_9ACTN|nr:hypothetical protein DLJ46_24985 [Micromonospora globispora]
MLSALSGAWLMSVLPLALTAVCTRSGRPPRIPPGPAPPRVAPMNERSGRPGAAETPRATARGEGTS